MNFRFIKTEKFKKFCVFIFVSFSILSIIIVYKNKKKDVETIPNEVQNDASKLAPDERMASTWSTQKVQEDPVSDSVSQKLIGSKNVNEEKVEDKMPSQSSTSILTESGVQITTPSNNGASSVLAKDIFTSNSYEKDGKIKDTPIMMRTALVNTETEEEQRMSHGQVNNESFSSNVSNKSENLSQKEVSSAKKFNSPRSKYELLLAANNGGLVELKGRDVSIGGADYQIKAGMRVLAFLPDRLVVTSASSQPTSLYVIGPMDQFSFPQGYVITATAKLNATEDRIDIESNFCSSSQNMNKSVSCVGTVKGVDGTTGLSGKIYNESMWSAIAAFATSSLAAIPLSQITQTSTSYGPVQSVSVANSINTALAAGVQSIGQSIQKGFDKSGTQISIPQGSIVQILFTQDVIL